MMRLIPLVLIFLSSLASAQPPKWAGEAIWYQIFVERFYNGDTGNDPSPDSMVGAYPGYIPAGWSITPWGQDWYEPDAWANKEGKGFHELVAARRYGGDLQGVIDKLDYLQELGITALYFNPLNDSPSLHKYDARHYRHIDIHFGPDPDGDAKLIATEDPVDPATWKWTAADRLFLKLIAGLHRRGMHLIVDYSWNHTGITFWAWQDLVKHQSKSRYRDWYDITSFDDPETPENEFQFHGWLGVKTLPELKKVNVSGKRDGHVFEGDLHPEVKAHIFNVTRRWLDPNGDGDPSDGVDGFRLDVAHHVPLGFWRDYRKLVRGINAEALLLGEAWWTKWPDELMDPRPFLKGDIFDSVMHYQWYRPARRFFAQANGGLKPSELVTSLKRVYADYAPATAQSLMNLTASHDSPRFASSFQNKSPYKFKQGARGNPTLDLDPPTPTTLREMRMMWLHQFTFLSAPHLWNGDELGMWGADDPDCRKPLLWEDVEHSPQTYRPDGTQTKPLPVQPNLQIRSYLKSLIKIRKAAPELTRGGLDWLIANDNTLTLAYARRTESHETIAAFNRSDETQTVNLEKSHPQDYTILTQTDIGVATTRTSSETQLKLTLSPMSGVLLRSSPH